MVNPQAVLGAAERPILFVAGLLLGIGGATLNAQAMLVGLTALVAWWFVFKARVRAAMRAAEASAKQVELCQKLQQEETRGSDK